jgi:hypothetical protein
MAMRDHDKYDLKAFIRRAFSVEEVTGIQVERILANSEHMKVGVVSRAILEELDPEVWMLNNFRGPGKFAFKPVVDGVWVGPLKAMRLGAADADPLLDDQGDVDATVSRVMKRESAISTIRQLQQLNDRGPKRGEDEMKPGEMVELIRAVTAIRGTEETTTLREELRHLRESLATTQRPPSLGEQIQPLIPLLTPLMGGISKSLIARVVLSLLPQPPEPTPIVENPPPTLGDQLRSILEQPHIQAMLAPLMQLVMQKMQTMNAIPHAPTVVNPQPPGGGSAMPTFKTDDPDVQEAISYIVLAISERRFSDAYASFQAFPELGQAFIGAIQPGVDAFPFMVRLRTLDDRLRTMPDNLRDFVKHIQTQIEQMMEEQQAVERDEARKEKK